MKGVNIQVFPKLLPNFFDGLLLVSLGEGATLLILFPFLAVLLYPSDSASAAELGHHTPNAINPTHEGTENEDGSSGYAYTTSCLVKGKTVGSQCKAFRTADYRSFLSPKGLFRGCLLYTSPSPRDS